MNTGIFGEGFPYSNFHDLNMDWIIKIAKDFLDQYSHIQEIIEQGETDIQELTNSGVEQLEEKADALTNALQAWYNEHSEDIANQLVNALADLNTWYTTHQNYLDQILTDNISTFSTSASLIGQQVIDSIPDDYTTLSNKVDALQNLLETGSANIPGQFAQGVRYWQDPSTIVSSDVRCCSIPIYMVSGNTLSVLNNASGTQFAILGGTSYDSGWKDTEFSITPVEEAYYWINVKNTDGGTNITPSDVDITITLTDNTSILNSIKNFEKNFPEINMFNGNYHIGGYLNSGTNIPYGTLLAQSNSWCFTDLIDIEKFTTACVFTDMLTQNSEFLHFYDVDKRGLGSVYSYNPCSISFPEGTRYIAASIITDHISSLVISPIISSKYLEIYSRDLVHINNAIVGKYRRLDHGETVTGKGYANNGAENNTIFPLVNSPGGQVSTLINLIGVSNISYKNVKYAKNLVMLDSTMRVISGGAYLTSNSAGTIEVPENAVACSYYCNINADIDTDIAIVEGTTPPDIIYPHDSKIYDGMTEKIGRNNLEGKTILFVGDSITSGINYDGGWVKMIGDKYNSITINEGHDGYTITPMEGRTDNLMTLVQNISGIYDIVCLSGGYNDQATYPRPTIGSITNTTYDELDTTTFCGAVEQYIRTARTKWKTSKMFFILTMKKEYTNSEQNTIQKQYFDTIRNICNKYAIPVIDLYKNSGLVGVQVTGVTDAITTEYYHNADGTHPNEKGYKYLTPIIANALMNMID